MPVLVACEESQAVTTCFRDLGFEAYSADILPTSGFNPEWHIQGDVRELLGLPWDLVIAFPPCTHLATSGARWFKDKSSIQIEAIEFFMLFANLPGRVAIENPVGIMSTRFRKPDQIVHPYYFGDAYSKKTCLWLKNLPPLVPTELVSKGEYITYASGRSLPAWYANTPKKNRSYLRSKTPVGLAKAMAKQWSTFIGSGSCIPQQVFHPGTRL